MSTEKLESWEKWLLRIVTALIITGVPTTVAYVVSIHDSLAVIEAKLAMQTYRTDQLEEAHKQLLAHLVQTDSKVTEQSKDIFFIRARLENSYAARSRIP